jgi:hypothetical protein
MTADTRAEYKVLRATAGGDYAEETRTIAGPFYHGGRARVRPGALLTAGRKPNSWGDTFDRRGNSVYVYFSAERDTAESYTRALGARGHLYEVAPTGEISMDNGGGDGAFKTVHPLRVIREIRPGS